MQIAVVQPFTIAHGGQLLLLSLMHSRCPTPPPLSLSSSAHPPIRFIFTAVILISTTTAYPNILTILISHPSPHFYFHCLSCHKPSPPQSLSQESTIQYFLPLNNNCYLHPHLHALKLLPTTRLQDITTQQTQVLSSSVHHTYIISSCVIMVDRLCK